MTAVEKLIYDVDFFGFYDEKYTLKKQIYSWRELRYTCHALGLPATSFDKAVRDNDIPEYIRARVSDYGIEYIGVRDLIDARYLDDHFSEATNLHSVEYQCDCVREALKLLENKQISFSMLHAARLLFYFYEDPTDIHGLKYDMTLLRKMLKYLGLILPTKRLDQLFRVMLMEASTKNQLQLFEFIQLIPKCQSIDPELERERQIARKETSTDRKMARSRKGSRIETRGGSYHQVGGSDDNRELPKDMRDFDRILTTPETRAQTRLDHDYDKRQFLFLDLFESSDVISELFKINSAKGYFGATRTTMHTQIESELRRDNRLESRLLTLDLNSGRNTIVNARSGHLRPRYSSAPQSRLSSYLEEKNRPDSTAGHSRWTKLQNVMKFARLAKRKGSSPHRPVFSQSKFRREFVPPIVSEQDKSDLNEKMSELNFRMSFSETINNLKL
ncbi:uncharacterized protein LOC142358401 [Convolutriloba macropyga]|uniref:uncharacterized protein LOC142358401 n=1 Tax=Convolutriloba macropyga TaxID=536237 RepID=UPI003F523B31